MTESIEIDGSLVSSLADLFRHAGDENDFLLGDVVGSLQGDRSLDTDELASAFQTHFHVNPGSAAARANAFIDRARGIAGTNGNQTIDTEEEARRFFDWSTSEEAFLLAGGVVVHNDVSDRNEVSIHLNCPGLTESDLRANAIPHEPWRYLAQMTMSFSSPVPGASDQYHLFNYLQVSFANRVIPALNLLSFSRSADVFRADWSLVDADDAAYASLIRDHRPQIEAALAAAGEDRDPEDVETVVNDFIELRDRVEASWGSHVLNETTGDFVHTQGSRVSMDSLAPDSSVIEATTETALRMCDDSRGRSRPEIPAWIYEDGSENASRDETVTPAD